MQQAFRDKIMPRQWLWCIINNLQKFDDKPEFIINLIHKAGKTKDHRILASFESIFNSIESYYETHNKFPDIAWLRLNFKGNITLVEANDEFSMQIYESIDKYVDQEILKQRAEVSLVGKDNINLDEIRDLARDLAKFTDNAVEISEETKESLINSYEDYSSKFHGLKTHIKPVDEVIGVLGYQSLSVFAAPSGHGKSTFAMSVAYYAARHGSCVDYLSFEIPSQHAWFNMVSIESEDKEVKLMSSKMKENLLNDMEKEAYKQHMTNLLNGIKQAGGYLNILDQTTASINTYEGLCAKLESVAEKRGRKADLIIVDNIDNFQTLKSSERDEATKINNYIISLDAFSKKYCNGEGTTILLLSQVNRPALKKLHTTEGDGDSGKTKIDVTCIQKYNALYEKATCVMIGYADESLRVSETMKIYPVKLRNRPIPLNPIKVHTKFGFSKVKGELPIGTYDTKEEARERMIEILSDDEDDDEIDEIAQNWSEEEDM